MIDHSIDDELHKLREEFEKLLNPEKVQANETTIPEQLKKFGLTLDEAKAWLEQEPNFFTNRRIFTDKRTDEDLTESIAPLYKG
jgi:hypothetical protein